MLVSNILTRGNNIKKWSRDRPFVHGVVTCRSWSQERHMGSAIFNYAHEMCFWFPFFSCARCVGGRHVRFVRATSGLFQVEGYLKYVREKRCFFRDLKLHLCSKCGFVTKDVSWSPKKPPCQLQNECFHSTQPRTYTYFCLEKRACAHMKLRVPKTWK